MANIIYSGTDTSITVVVTGMTLNLTDTITACLIRNGVRIAPATQWTCSNAAPGANWSTGLVVVEIADTDTVSLVSQLNVLVELKIVTVGGVVSKRITEESYQMQIRKGVL